MATIVVIGDALNCVGFRLAGVETRSPAPDELAGEFTRALAAASLIVLGRRTAKALAPRVLQQALAGESPLVVVLPDIAAPAEGAGAVARRVRAILGIEA
jgi:vacuolar-type H+-ATPase subunit F/Vma7